MNYNYADILESYLIVEEGLGGIINKFKKKREDKVKKIEEGKRKKNKEEYQKKIEKIKPIWSDMLKYGKQVARKYNTPQIRKELIEEAKKVYKTPEYYNDIIDEINSEWPTIFKCYDQGGYYMVIVDVNQEIAGLAYDYITKIGNEIKAKFNVSFEQGDGDEGCLYLLEKKNHFNNNYLNKNILLLIS